MPLMYSIKAIAEDGRYTVQPCSGAYSVFEENGFLQVRACMEDKYFSTEQYPAIYVENVSGTTVDKVLRKAARVEA